MSKHTSINIYFTQQPWEDRLAQLTLRRCLYEQILWRADQLAASNFSCV